MTRASDAARDQLRTGGVMPDPEARFAEDREWMRGQRTGEVLPVPDRSALLSEAAEKMLTDEDVRWAAVADWVENVRHRAFGSGLPVAREVEVERASVVAQSYLGHAHRPDPRADAMGELHAFVGADDEERV